MQMSESMYTTYSFVKQKYFAPVEMLYNILEIGIQYFMMNITIKRICKD